MITYDVTVHDISKPDEASPAFEYRCVFCKRAGVGFVTEPQARWHADLHRCPTWTWYDVRR